jgi:hypothetical protein
MVAVQQTAYSMVRPYLEPEGAGGQRMPAWLTAAVGAAVPAMLALGDDW